MTDDEERSAIATWRAGRRVRSDQAAGWLVVRLWLACPTGAVRLCTQHRWVPQPDGATMRCAVCGLTSGVRIG